jgi:hypothetical protein
VPAHDVVAKVGREPRVGHAPDLGRDEAPVTILAAEASQGPGHSLFTAPTTVDVRRVEERHTLIDRRAQDAVGGVIRHLAPLGTQLPTAETDLGDATTVSGKDPGVHARIRCACRPRGESSAGNPPRQTDATLGPQPTRISRIPWRSMTAWERATATPIQTASEQPSRWPQPNMPMTGNPTRFQAAAAGVDRCPSWRKEQMPCSGPN